MRERPGDNKMKKIYIQEEYCIGCRLCEIYCQVKHSKSKKIIKAFREEKHDILSRVLVEEIGYNSFAIQCRHCQDAPCVDEDIPECVKNCPNEALKFVEKDKNKEIQVKTKDGSQKLH